MSAEIHVGGLISPLTEGLDLTVGITLAILSALTNFAFLPYYPFWALTIIALDVFIIWALAAHGRELAR